MSDDTHILHFSLGPVQGFIQEARRTRDLWAGSFLLSWLSGQAMAVLPAGAEIIFPDVTGDKLYKAIMKAKEGADIDDPVWLGTLGNHFKAEVPKGFNPQVCVDAVRGNWLKVTGAVREEFLMPVLEANPEMKASVQAVWNAQVGEIGEPSPFWETHWAFGPEPKIETDDLGWLDARKMTRFASSALGGESYLCTLMSGMEQLGGRLGRHGSDAFWLKMRERISQVIYRRPYEKPLDLRESEHLCAIALIKRLFPALPAAKRKEIIGWDPGARNFGEGDNERRVRFWPSTGHIAAAPWLKIAGAHAKTELGAFAGKMSDLDKVSAVAEKGCVLRSLEGVGTSAWLDGRLFYAKQEKDLEPSVTAARNDAKADDALGLLDALRKAEFNTADGKVKIGRPSPYFAVIAADGDRMGKAMRGPDRKNIPAALANFAEGMRELFKCAEHHGALIYAGGDDVLALASVDSALDLAIMIKTVWDDAVRELMDEVDGASLTLSVAISFVHMKRVLRWSIAETQLLLNSVAKESMERDALAVQVLRAGTPNNIWAGKWDAEGPIGALQSLIMADVGDNRTTYGLARKLPWIWPVSAGFLEVVDGLRSSAPAYDISSIEDDDLASLIGAAIGVQSSEAANWVRAGRFLRDVGGHAEEHAPMNPGLLEILRFMKLHRRPVPALAEEEASLDA